MSSEAAVALVERIKSDEAFQSKLAGAGNLEERLALARDEGFDVHAEDIGEIRRTLGVEELSDEDLEKVAGGTGTTTNWTIGTGTSIVVGAVAGEVAAAI